VWGKDCRVAVGDSLVVARKEGHGRGPTSTAWAVVEDYLQSNIAVCGSVEEGHNASCPRNTPCTSRAGVAARLFKLLMAVEVVIQPLRCMFPALLQ